MVCLWRSPCGWNVSWRSPDIDTGLGTYRYHWVIQLLCWATLILFAASALLVWSGYPISGIPTRKNSPRISLQCKSQPVSSWVSPFCVLVSHPMRQYCDSLVASWGDQNKAILRRFMGVKWGMKIQGQQVRDTQLETWKMTVSMMTKAWSLQASFNQFRPID